MKILTIEDTTKLLASITDALLSENFLCESAETFSEADEKLHLYSYDCMIIDINLPDGSGLDLIKAIKSQNPSTGVIVISARNSLSNKIEGLSLGADDYITKPFDMSELIARVKAVLRRRNFFGSNKVTFGEIAVEPETRDVFVCDQRVELTRAEFDILIFFFSNPGRVLTREAIAEHIFGDHMDLVDSFDFIYSHMKNLRKKITPRSGHYPIKAIYGVGYKMETAV
jgi:DNA-binding response OmpR family regulator